MLARKWNVPGASTNPTAGLGTAPEVHRQRFLTPEEARRLVAAALTFGVDSAADVLDGWRRLHDAHALVYACGPPRMLEAVRALCAARSVPAQLALEAPMACGFGACFGCAVPRRGGGYLRVCVDGPVVDADALERIEDHPGQPS